MKLAKASIVYRAARDVGSLFAVILFSGGFAATSSPLGLLIAPFIIVGMIALTVGWEYLVWKNYDYEVTENNVEISKGVIRKSRREIPLRRIQNVDINRNIVQQVLGIAKVNLETAGGNETEAALSFVELEEAQNIQRQIRQLKRGKEPEKTDEEERELLLELSSKELMLLGITSFNAQLALFFLFGLGFFGAALGSVLEGAGLGAVAGMTVLFLILLVLTWIGGLTNAFLTYFDFKLWRAEGSIEYQRGLLNRAEGSIPFEKVQKLVVSENPLKRLIGYSTLNIETAGYSAENQMQSSAEAVVPLAERDKTLDFARMIEHFSDFEVQSIPERARLRYLVRYMIAVSVLFVLAFVANYFVSVNYWVVLILVPVVAVAAHLKWENIGYVMTENHFIVQSGFWSRQTMIVPYYRIQNLIESQTVFQRRWSLASLTLDIAGTNRFQKDPVAIDLDSEDAERLREEVFRKFQESLVKNSAMTR